MLRRGFRQRLDEVTSGDVVLVPDLDFRFLAKLGRLTNGGKFFRRNGTA